MNDSPSRNITSGFLPSYIDDPSSTCLAVIVLFGTLMVLVLYFHLASQHNIESYENDLEEEEGDLYFWEEG